MNFCSLIGNCLPCPTRPIDQGGRSAARHQPASQGFSPNSIQWFNRNAHASSTHARTHRTMARAPATSIYRPPPIMRGARRDTGRVLPAPLCAPRPCRSAPGKGSPVARRPGPEGAGRDTRAACKSWQARRGANLELASDVVRSRAAAAPSRPRVVGRPAARALLCTVLACHRATSQSRPVTSGDTDKEGTGIWPHSRKAFWAHIHLTGGGHVPGPHSTDFHPSTPWLTVLPFRYIHRSDPAAWPRTQLLAIRTSKPADSRIGGRLHHSFRWTGTGAGG